MGRAYFRPLLIEIDDAFLIRRLDSMNIVLIKRTMAEEGKHKGKMVERIIGHYKNVYDACQRCLEMNMTGIDFDSILDSIDCAQMKITAALEATGLKDR